MNEIVIEQISTVRVVNYDGSVPKGYYNINQQEEMQHETNE